MVVKILTATAIAFFLFIISMVGCQTHLGLAIKDVISSIPFGDKLVHLGMMVVLSYLLFYAMKRRQVNILGRNLLLSSLILAIGITVEEFSQLFIPARNFEILDLICNYAGIYLGSQTPGIFNLKHLYHAKHFGSEAFSVQTVRHSAGPVYHESGHGRRTVRRLVRHHGRR
jgi:polysaccharide biosynthesis protein VpsQ